jgi:EmrB/QacA subfamily drug resistance transporter
VITKYLEQAMSDTVLIDQGAGQLADPPVDAPPSAEGTISETLSDSVKNAIVGHPVRTFVITSVALFMAQLDNLVVTTALPSIQKSLHGSLQSLQWTVSAYTLTFAVFLMMGSALGDRFGRRRLFVLGLGLFTLASAAAALAPNMGALVAARAVQGLGGAIIVPLTMTLLSAAIRPERRGAAIGAWGAVGGLAVAVGPVVGGAVVEGASWHWIFWLNVPIGVVMVPLARWWLAESRGTTRRLDTVGTLLASAGLFGFVLGLIRGGSVGWTNGLVLTGFVLGGALLAGFVGWELRIARAGGHPMLPMRLFRNRGFSMVNLSSLLMAFGMFGSVFLLAQLFQLVFGDSPLKAGVWMLPWTAMPMLIAPIAGILSDRIPGRSIAGTGLFLQAGALAWLAAHSQAGTPYLHILPGLILGGIGMAMFFAPVGNVVLSAVRRSEEGIASGANNALRELGGVLGIAVMGAIFAARGGYGATATQDAQHHFAAGVAPAVWTGSAVVLVAAIAMWLVPKTRSAR